LKKNTHLIVKELLNFVPQLKKETSAALNIFILGAEIYHSIKLKSGSFWKGPLSELREDFVTAKIDETFFFI